MLHYHQNGGEGAALQNDLFYVDTEVFAIHRTLEFVLLYSTNLCGGHTSSTLVWRTHEQHTCVEDTRAAHLCGGHTSSVHSTLVWRTHEQCHLCGGHTRSVHTNCVHKICAPCSCEWKNHERMRKKSCFPTSTLFFPSFKGGGGSS